MPFADIRFFAPHGVNGPHVMAVDSAAEALNSQGMEVTKRRDNLACGFTNASLTVTGVSQALDDELPLFDEEQRVAYRVVAVPIVGTNWTLDRVYEGATNAASRLHILSAGPTAAVVPMNPDRVVIGGFVP